MKTLLRIAVAVLLMMIAVAPAQRRRRDPLNPPETDQLREVAMEPEKKIKLYVTFARARLTAIEQLRKDPKFAADRGQRIHDLLEDFTNIIDEMDTNMSDFQGQRADFRKALKEVIEGDSDFQLRLRTLKEAPSSDPQAAKEARDYSFALTNAIEAVDSNLDDARDLLDKQNAAAAAAKKKK